MREETGNHEGEDIAIEDLEKEDYVCSSCRKRVDTVYFYCEKCHKAQKDRDRKEQIEQKEEVNEKGESENDKG